MERTCLCRLFSAANCDTVLLHWGAAGSHCAACLLLSKGPCFKKNIFCVTELRTHSKANYPQKRTRAMQMHVSSVWTQWWAGVDLSRRLNYGSFVRVLGKIAVEDLCDRATLNGFEMRSCAKAEKIHISFISYRMKDRRPPGLEQGILDSEKWETKSFKCPLPVRSLEQQAFPVCSGITACDFSLTSKAALWHFGVIVSGGW